ncbi:hypothetical protein EVC28_037 [Rhizobium phage RHph_I1_23]|nr:hypothetical protein EVC28_037 [Rhizobium phage RHph_I1_23]
MSDPNPQMMFGEPVGPWHDWFAWFPIRTYDQRLVWLRWVRRRSILKHWYLHGGPDFWWQYHNQRSAA